ncbi:MAG: hypothetical protein H0U55_10250 [Rubrobacteraceae bacterium]|nr:hypothetical protein [Rubrobacteraceae bacterium]
MMFREMQHMDHSLRAMDLAEKMAERRNQALAATRKPSLMARLARMLISPAMSSESSPAEGRA